MADSGTRTGYLLIADISGYTAFLTGVELEHAQAIIEDLFHSIHETLVPALTFVKLEGDALFCYGDASRFSDGERLLELMESCYYSFQSRLEDMKRHTTCTCAACRSIGTLDLKFVGHYGDFIVRKILDTTDLAGPDVILVHRLLKNGVSGDTGLRGYALLTAACSEHLPGTAGWHQRTEAVDAMGDVHCVVSDLKPSASARQEAHRVFVEHEEADFEIVRQLPASPPVVWQYWNDADKRLRWATEIRAITFDKNQRDRMGEGAIGHCDHGSWASDMRYVDWRPFSYFTLERKTTRSSLLAMSAPELIETLELVPLPNGTTELRYRMKAHKARGRLMMKLAGPLISRSMGKDLGLLKQVLVEDGVAIQTQ